MYEGELVLLDIGAEVEHYSADVTRTIPVSGLFSNAQRDIYNIVIEAQQEAIEVIRPGSTIGEVHRTARDVVKHGLKRLGLITDTNSNQYRMWFMHGTSHWIGLDVHDAGRRDEAFQPGMVLTVEPGIYIRSDALDYLEDTPDNQQLKAAIRPAFEKYINIGVRIEDDIIVTETGYEIISNAAPRTIDEIERLMRRK
jgi:Xaa-Pro aminopeptidase